MSTAITLVDELDALEAEALKRIRGAADGEGLEAARIEYLGRKEGRISAILRRLGDLPANQRPRVGARANQVKETVQGALEARARELGARDTGEGEGPDLSLPGRGPWIGGRHPVTRVVDEIVEIFAGLGFTRARGPEAESTWYNFVALNTPLDHPAADEQDTIYLEDDVVLRSHTSPVQIRTLQTSPPPVRILAPGMVYRQETQDATHSAAFAQIEGLAVDEGITFVDFKATLAEFARRFFGAETRVRFRPSFFPFTEPSAEMDVKRLLTRADGTTYESDWLEIMGAGMVDPAVLDNAGVDPERYTGFAFGMGPGRIAMLRYGIGDIRTFFENDVRFLRQFVRGASRPCR